MRALRYPTSDSLISPRFEAAAARSPRCGHLDREARRADSPWTIHRAVEQLHAMGCQLCTRCIHVIHRDCELESRPGLAAGDGSRLDEIDCCSDLEQVDQSVRKLENSRVLVFEEHREAKDLPVEELRPLQILNEQRDGVDGLRRRIHFFTMFP